MSRRWPDAATRSMARRGDDRPMLTRDVSGITIRPLRNGDAGTVLALFDRLGDESRRRRFGAAKPRLTQSEVAQLARVDGTHHVLVAHVPGDPRPAGIARLVRDGSSAEVACAVADECQGLGIGGVLLEELTALARAAGIVELRATVVGDNPRIVSLLTRLGRRRESRWSGGELELVLGL
jgi:GNAT superfamily N-acetyltransferase